MINIDENYRPRKFDEELRESIGRRNHFDNSVVIGHILEARSRCLEIVRETNEYIDSKLQELELPGVRKIIFVPDQDPTIIIKIERDISGQFQLNVEENENEYEPDMLSVKFN